MKKYLLVDNKIIDTTKVKCLKESLDGINGVWIFGETSEILEVITNESNNLFDLIEIGWAIEYNNELIKVLEITNKNFNGITRRYFLDNHQGISEEDLINPYKLLKPNNKGGYDLAWINKE